MRTTIVMAAGLALIATSAMGQSSSRDRRDWEDRDGYDQSDWRDAPRYDRGGRRVTATAGTTSEDQRRAWRQLDQEPARASFSAVAIHVSGSSATRGSRHARAWTRP
jgi:hypothetical protein